MKAEDTLLERFDELPFKTLVEEIKDFAIFHLTPEGFIISWNQGAEKIFGYSKGIISDNLLLSSVRRKTVLKAHTNAS